MVAVHQAICAFCAEEGYFSETLAAFIAVMCCEDSLLQNHPAPVPANVA